MIFLWYFHMGEKTHATDRSKPNRISIVEFNGPQFQTNLAILCLGFAAGDTLAMFVSFGYF